jgi:hypothetical protein
MKLLASIVLFIFISFAALTVENTGNIHNIPQDIVKAHGGELMVETKDRDHLGTPTTFTIIIPIT